MRYVEAKKCEVIQIGRQGENEVETVQFDVSGWAEKYGDGTFTLLHQRSRDTAPYECPIEVDGETVSWIVRNTDTAYGGIGEAQLIYTVNEAVAKSIIFETKTYNSLDGNVVLPDPYDDWLREIHEDAEFTRENMDKVVQAEAYADIAAEKAREASEFVGSPLVANLANEMTDHDKVYVYVGNEVGMNNGDWYYWDGAAWVDGGVYNSVAVDTDTTLSVSGKAADAKIVGDEVATLNTNIERINSNPKEVSIPFTVDGSGGVSYTTGDVFSSSSLSHTDYIDVSQYGQLRYKHPGHTAARGSVSAGLAFYDQDKTFISGVQNKCNQTSIGYLSYASLVTVPSNAKYVVFSVFTNTSTYGEFYVYGISKLWLSIHNSEIDVIKEENPIGAVVWEDICGDGTYTQYNGWEKGYWSSSNVASESKYMMRYWTYLTSNMWRISGAKKLLFEVPDTYVLIFQGFGGNGYTTRVEYYEIRGSRIIPLTDGLRYRMHLRQLDFDDMTTSGRGNQTILDELKVVPIVEDTVPVTRNQDGRRYFTVNVNRAWTNTSATSTANAEGSDPADIQCVIQLPTAYRPSGKATPLIMFCHGASSNVTESKWYENNANFNTLLDAFNTAGFAVFDVANTRNQDGGFLDWGCLPLMEAYIKAWEYIKANFNVEKRLYIYSCSMGTCACLNMLKWYGSEVVTALMTAPRPICKTRYESLTGDSKTNFESAFGITTGEWESRLNGFNHYENIVEIDSVPHILENFPPVKVMVGTADEGFLTETRAYYAALANNGNFVNYREVSGANHDRMTFLSTDGLRAEAVAWFNRFKQ